VIFTREGEQWVPTGHARGPWDPEALHGGAPAGLITREVESLAPGMRLARLTVEFLGAVPLAPLRVHAEIVKPGRRLQVAEAALGAGGREVCRARAILLRRAAFDEPPAPGDRPGRLAARPERAERTRLGGGESFASTGMDVRFVAGSFAEAGPAVVWYRLDRPLVAGEEPTGAQRAVAAADFGNGASRVLDWERWLFVNTDLTVHLHRHPVGEWVGLAARTAIEPDGSGLSVSDLHDEQGAIGVALQTLFVGPR
jgi:hypothetical protein